MLISISLRSQCCSNNLDRMVNGMVTWNSKRQNILTSFSIFSFYFYSAFPFDNLLKEYDWAIIISFQVCINVRQERMSWDKFLIGTSRNNANCGIVGCTNLQSPFNNN